MAKSDTVELCHIGDLSPSDRNPRQHTPRSIGAIVSSLNNVGPWRSIAIDEDRRVVAGNGVIEAAAEAGIENVLIVRPPANTIVAVERGDLSEAQKRQYEIADNLIPTLSEWDALQLEHNADEFKFDLVSPALFNEDEVSKLADELLKDAVAKQAAQDEPPDKELQVIVTCRDYEQQQELIARLEGEGFKCKGRRKPRKK